jgi:hypothetical protein
MRRSTPAGFNFNNEFLNDFENEYFLDSSGST